MMTVLVRQMKSNTDFKIVKGLQLDSEQSLNKCIKVYTPYVAYIVGNIIGTSLPQEDKEEVVSDVFVTLWEKRYLIDANRSEKLKAYIGTIARNLSIDKLRKSRKYTLREELDENLADEFSLEIIFVRGEQAGELMQCIQQLKRIDQICFLKYYYYQKTIKEIADELDLNESAVKSKLYRGREKLRGMLLEGKKDD